MQAMGDLMSASNLANMVAPAPAGSNASSEGATQALPHAAPETPGWEGCKGGVEAASSKGAGKGKGKNKGKFPTFSKSDSNPEKVVRKKKQQLACI